MKKPIRIISTNFELLGEISNYESLMYTRSWSGIGVLEMRINRYKKYADQLQKGKIIFPFNELHKAYLILHKEIELNENGKVTENWLIRALQIKVITGRRITLPPVHTAYDNKSGPAETVMKHFVNNNVVNPIDINRRISQLIIVNDKQRGMNISWQSRFKNLAEELSAISLVSGLGWNISLNYNTKLFEFDVQEGRDLTANNSFGNSPVIFSPQFDSVKNLAYVQSELNYKNMAFVAGQGEGVERRVIALHDNLTGLDRHELFIDARDVEEATDDDPPQQRPEVDIIADLTNRGEQQLQEFLQEEYLEGQILTKSPFVYEKDYDLGDIVTVQNKDWGITMDARITEIKEIYETSGYSIEATFGNNRPTLINKIKQELSQISGEIRR